MASQSASYIDRHGKTVYLLFNGPILAAGQLKQDVAQAVVLQPPSINTATMALTFHTGNHKNSYQSAQLFLRTQRLGGFSWFGARVARPRNTL